MAGPLYDFRPVQEADLALLRSWQQRPHVKQWWGSEDLFNVAALADQRVARWLVSCSGQPFAYIQDYTPHGWDNHPFYHLPKGSRGVDQLIGELDMVGKGHGQGFIRQHMQTLFAQGVPVVATDPDPENARAIAVYQKVGFRIEGPVKETQWGTILPMVAYPSG